MSAEMDRFQRVFPRKPVIARFSVDGEPAEARRRVLTGIDVLERRGIDAVLLQGSDSRFLEEVLTAVTTAFVDVPFGVTVLPNGYVEAFTIAKDFGLHFVYIL